MNCTPILLGSFPIKLAITLVMLTSLNPENRFKYTVNFPQ